VIYITGLTPGLWEFGKVPAGIKFGVYAILALSLRCSTQILSTSA